MKPFTLFGLSVAAVIVLNAAASVAQTPPANPDTAQFDAQGRFLPPADYRDWVFLSSGVDMSYSEAAAANPDRHSFTNTFAPRAAVEAFKRQGKWPDKTVLALDVRGGASKGSINKHGVFQSGEAQGVEFHVKDEARFKGGWGFYGPSGGKPATMIPTAAACYACHQDHAAADTTFVQFYPTLLPMAEKLGALSPKYLAEEKAAKP